MTFKVYSAILFFKRPPGKYIYRSNSFPFLVGGWCTQLIAATYIMYTDAVETAKKIQQKTPVKSQLDQTSIYAQREKTKIQFTKQEILGCLRYRTRVLHFTLTMRIVRAQKVC